MWGIVWFFLGSCRVRLTGARVQWALNELARRRIAFRDIVHTDEWSVEVTILTRDLARAQLAAQRAMCSLTLLRRRGAGVLFRGLLRRPGLLAALGALVLAAVVLPKFVWFYEVTGNVRVPTARILREVAAAGADFGTYGPSIKPQEIKNRVLVRIPELQWLTIQQSGGKAVIVVRERPQKESINDRRTPRNVIASRAGVLTKVDVYEGGSLCKVGDVVTAGQLLVSGYLDWGYKTQVVGALAEIYATTWRKNCTVLPDTALLRERTGVQHRSVSLLLGRRRIPLFGAGNAARKNCEKTTEIRYFTLPGGLSLPLGLEITVQTEYDTREKQADEAAVRTLLEQDVRTRVQTDMIAGTIRMERGTLRHDGGCWRLYTVMECEEMIARMVNARLLEE